MALATRVIDFSTGQSLAASGVSVFLDELLNVNSAGEQVSQFSPGDTIHLLATIPAEYRFVMAAATGGMISQHGLVSRSQTDQMLFAATGEAQGLSRQAAGHPSMTWYGNVGSVTFDNALSTLAAAPGSLLPCLADAEYPYLAQSIALQTATMVLSKDETWPYGIVVYVVKA